MEQIYEFCPIEPLVNFWPKFCAKFYSKIRQRFNRAKFKNLFHTDFPIRMFYTLVLKFLKNIEKCGLQMIWREKILQKIFFGHLGIPQKWKKLKNFDFPKSTENALKMILRPKWGDFGAKWTCGAVLKWDNTKMKNRHVPPFPP